MNKVKKERVDVLLVERGICETREKAKRAIMAGVIFSGSERMDKPGEKIAHDAPLEKKGNDLRYVSRGGLKLEKALAEFDVSVDGKMMLDIGSSTGGFTDCALQNGARHGYALDVGYNQLAWTIRQDPRVTVMERTNFRHCKPEDFTEGLPEMATIDVSFISLRIILPVLKTILVPGGDCIALVKPQFEAGRDKVGKKGIVREPKVHQEVLEKVASYAVECGFEVRAMTHSPITGGEGNIEFLFHLVSNSTEEKSAVPDMRSIEQTVEHAHAAFKEKASLL
ncbi:TlyA family RNA methyltransferase [Planococcus dechangensis]|uniref:TlyA family RNA methyltransferase n=1 Tax=Planococcus dechangensis TaxID=1176255 RepID=A0ABV9M9D9_9BACL